MPVTANTRWPGGNAGLADDIDPIRGGQTIADLAACLRRLRAKAGAPSYRQLEQWGRRHRKPFPRSSVSDLLSGKRLPARGLYLPFVEACGVNLADDTRWITAWTLLAEGTGEQRLDAAPVVPERLADDMRTAGLLRLGTTYLAELEWKELFAGVSELDVFVAYGQTWRASSRSGTVQGRGPRRCADPGLPC